MFVVTREDPLQIKVNNVWVSEQSHIVVGSVQI